MANQYLKALHFYSLVTLSCAALAGVGYIVMEGTRGNEKHLASEMGLTSKTRLTDEQRKHNQAILDMIQNSRNNADETPIWRK
ncbi:hypothetical protein HDU98_002722 [Podochytrium sp. JEL0797]|nr:hypothetical protein HDU98_002722 [Podochytrium sp. JEL0797]